MKRSRTSRIRLLCQSFGQGVLPLLLFGLLTVVRAAPADRLITGRVLGETADPLPGVTVLVKGAQTGTVTDANGAYSIRVPDSPTATLIFSFIGYASQEIVTNQQTTINVTLVPDSKALNEVVVVGYGEQRKRDVTGSVSSVSAKQIRNIPVPGVDQALAGQVAGVQVQQTTGAPGGNVNVRIRGSGSIGAGNEPLYVVDGFPGVTNLNAINPNDIESVEVLKDASAAAIYGSRGANGVVIITTKRGRAGKTTFQVDAYTGWQQVLKKVDMMNATEFAEHHIRSRNNGYAEVGGNTDFAVVKNSKRPVAYQIFPGFLENDSSGRVNPALGVGTDWQDAIFRIAPVQSVQLTANGGTEKVRYAITGGYFNQEGIVISSGYKRYSVRLNVDADLSQRVKLGVNLAPSFAQRRLVNSDDTWSQQGIILTALSISPHLPLNNPDGTRTVGQFGLVGLNAMQNPVAIAEDFKMRANDFTTTGNAYLDIQLAKGLVARTAIGVNLNASAYNSYYPSTLGRLGPPPSVARGEARSSLLVNWVNSNTLTYTRTLGERHNLSVLLGNETQKQRVEDTYLRGEKYSSDAAQSISAAGQITQGSGGVSEWALLSYFGRFTYDYASRYLLTLNVRRDGSSRFGPTYKWGTFPSASVGWQVGEEAFMQPLRPVLSSLKLRASYGVGGNNNIGNYAYRSLLADQNYVLGAGVGELVTGLAPNGLGNPDLRWETSRQADIGLDAGLFDGRLQFTADYYDKRTEDLLLNVNIPRLSGYSQVLTNIGKVRNWGYEFSLTSQNLTGSRLTGQTPGISWTTNLNVSINRNQVLALGPTGDPIIRGTSQISDSHITQVGQPLGNFYGYQIIGVFNTQAEIDSYARWASGNPTRPGDYKFRDVNEDGVLNANDRTVLGNAYPKFIYGLTNTFTYRGVELSVLIQGSQGVSVLNGTRRFNGSQQANSNQLAEVGEGRWRSATEPGTGYSRPWNGAGANNNLINMNSSWIEDGSFLRVRTVSLAYQLPGELVQRIKLRNLRVYALVQNALMFTKYRGFNPEVSFSAEAVLNPGVDYGTYPIPRTLTLGLTTDF